MIVLEVNLISTNSSEFIFSVILDKVRLIFGLIVTLISGSVFMFSRQYIETELYFYRFTLILLRFVISMCVLIFSGSFLSILVGWDGLGVTSFALIIFYQSKDSLTAGYQTFLINRLGDVFIIISFIMFLFIGQFCFSYSLTGRITLLLTLAALTKRAQYPFSRWLPAAMAAPTPVSALVHSSTLVTSGIYIILRINIQLELSENITNMLLLSGSITCLLGGTAAIFEYDLKKIIALSTLSQLGLMVFTLGIGAPDLTLFHLFTHALFKALLFIAAGCLLITAFGSQDLRFLGGVSNTLPFCSVIINVSGLSLIGIPFLSAFYSKHVILDKIIMTNMNLFSFLVILVASIITIIYTVRIIKTLVWDKPIIRLVIKNNTYIMYVPMFVLSTFSIFSGKIFVILENWFINYTITPNFIILNIILLVGVTLGLISKFNVNTYLWSTLFYLTPIYNNSSKLITTTIISIKNLDYGWLELSPIINNIILQSSSKFEHTLIWPKHISGFYRVFLLGLIITIYFNSNF